MAYRNYSPHNGYVVDPTGNGDFTTVTAACTAIFSETSVAILYLNPGIYGGTITIPTNFFLQVFTAANGGFGDGSLATGILGNVTLNPGSSISFNNIIYEGLITGSSTGQNSIDLENCVINDVGSGCISLSGSSRQTVTLTGCTLNGVTANPFISNTNSNGSTSINISDCAGSVGSTGSFFSSSSPGSIFITNSVLTGGGSGSSSASAGGLLIDGSIFQNPISATGTCSFSSNYSNFGSSGLNVLPVTISSSPSSPNVHVFSYFASSGTTAALSVTTTAQLSNCTFFAGSNANIISGAGTITYNILTTQGSTSGIVPTQVHQGVSNIQLFGGAQVLSGSGAPTLTAPQGSLWLRTDGSSTSTRLYVNTNGSTGWTNFVSAT
jgi:hypothetical protein